MGEGWTRRSLIQGAAACAATLLTGPALHAQPIPRFNLAHGFSASHPIAIRLQEAAERIQARAAGRLQMHVFPAGELGNDTMLLLEAQLGGLELAALPALELESVALAALVTATGFAFTEDEKRWESLDDGALGSHIRDTLPAGGLTAFAKAFDGGFRNITSFEKPITSPSLLEGFRIRTPIDQLRRSIFSSLGAVPLFIGLPETYTALENRALDGQETPFATMLEHKLFEVQRFCTLTRHSFECVWLVANSSALQTLSPDLRAILDQEFARAAELQRKDMIALFEEQKDVLVLTGMTFAETDPAPFRDALRERGYYKRWREAFGAETWEKLEAATGPLA